MDLNQIFNNTKLTENGDIAYSSTGDNLLDILFMSEYYQHHLDEVHIGTSEEEKLFAMFMRDPRFGIGRRDLGRKLMHDTECSIEQVVKAGRVDDLFYVPNGIEETYAVLDFLKKEIESGNELVKKWMPRYSSKNLLLARYIAAYWGMNKQQYGHFIKSNTTENKLSRKNYDDIDFEHVPSLAMIKYAHAFATKPELSKRYAEYLEAVKAGKKDLKIATTTVYDIYRNQNTIDPDLFFSKIEKISGSWIPIVDTSGSMCDGNDSFGKALALGHYLAKCSSYCPNSVVSFSSQPQLIELGKTLPERRSWYWHDAKSEDVASQYRKEIASMFTGDCSNTDFGKVMDLLSKLDNYPEYLIVLSDMEFDCGSNSSKDKTMAMFKERGANTKIIWWNLNPRHTTSPETDAYGNIFLSGYNPLLLKFLEVGFDGKQFLNRLLDEYQKFIEK